MLLFSGGVKRGVRMRVFSEGCQSRGVEGGVVRGSNDISLHEVELSGNYRCQ